MGINVRKINLRWILKQYKILVYIIKFKVR